MALQLGQSELKAISALSGLAPDDCRIAFENFLRANERRVIEAQIIRDQFGWSFQTWKRRIREFGVTEVSVPGWKLKKGVYLDEFQEKTGLVVKSLQNGGESC